jgi:hypothetical protein
MKSKLTLIVAFLAVFVGSLFISIFPTTPNLVFAENNPAKICKDSGYGTGDSAKYCQIGFRGGYDDHSQDETCGTDTSPKGDINNSTKRGACAAGVQFGAAEKKKDNNGRPAPTPTGNDLEAKADAACKSDHSGDSYEACKRGYKAANAQGATQDSVEKLCDKEKTTPLKNFCREGVRLSGVNDLRDIRDLRPDPDAGDDKKDEEEDQVDCDLSLSSILSWIACPIIDMGVNFTDFAFQHFIQPMLENVPVSTDPNDASFKAWKSFRLIANVLLIGSLLVIVYSQAKGGGGK